MANDKELQVIELQQLPVIIERLHSVKAEIEAKTAEATSLICTEDTYKTVKAARTNLTKDFKALEAQRIAVKKKILEPYDAFEEVYQECVAGPYKKADAELKKKIDEVTSGIVANKTQEVVDYYHELIEAAGIDWIADLNYHPKVNMSSSVSGLKEQTKAFVDGIVADVAAISNKENSAEIMVEYRKDLSLAAAIKTVDDRHKALDEQRRREEEYRVRMAERKVAEERTKDAMAAEPAAEPPVVAREMSADPEAVVQTEPQPELAPDPVLMTRFYAKGTRAQLIGLKQYMERNGIEYGNV